MPLEEMVFGEEISRQEDEASGWIVAHSRKKQRQDFFARRQPWPQCRVIKVGGLDNRGRGAGHRSRSRDKSASCARIQQEPTWAERVGPKRESRTIVQRQLPEQATARIQQLEHENATLRSELQEIKALVEELRQHERTPEGAVKVQQAEAQPRGGKRKAADPPVDIEKEFNDFKQEIMGGGP
ncbi:hypothetical protein MRX96_020987 [Rhipicephalus microplus]